MKVIVQSCERFFELPLCNNACGGVVHTLRCWDEEYWDLWTTLGDSQSDVRALERSNELLKKENVDLKATISVMRGDKTASTPWADAIGYAMNADGMVYESVIDMVKGYQSKPTSVHHVMAGADVRRLTRADGRVIWQCSDGKMFDHKSQAMRHAELLQKGP